MTLSREDLQAIADIVTNNVMQRIETEKQREKAQQLTYAEWKKQQEQSSTQQAQPKKERKPQVKVQVQNRKPLEIPPTFKSLKQLKAEKEAELQRAKEEKANRMVKCIICGEEFHPTSAVNRVCPNKLCREINKYNGVIKKHIAERQQELAQEEME